MFGRRNPDPQPGGIPPAPSTTDLDLDLLPDLPDVPMPAPAEPATPSVAPAPAAAPASTSVISSPVKPSAPAPVAATPVIRPAAVPVKAVPQPALTPSAQPIVNTAMPSNGTASVRAKLSSESIIGPDDYFDGRYRSERGVRIQGNARGSIESHQYIFVEEGAQVEADLSAEDITIAGKFMGKIECRRRLEIMSSGKVQGQVQTALLIVQEGGMLDGELHMEAKPKAPASPPASPPAKKQA